MPTFRFWVTVDGKQFENGAFRTESDNQCVISPTEFSTNTIYKDRRLLRF